jgi:hypothetical protein
MTVANPWHEGDIIKTPDQRLYSVYNEASGAFSGTLKGWDYTQMYMVFSMHDNTLRLCGDQLQENDKVITLHGDGQWNVLPCLFDQVTPITEALADYYDDASAGDLLKAHNRFAVFSANKQWIGDLTALRPGEGYLFRRMGTGAVKVSFYDRTPDNAPRRTYTPSEKGTGDVLTGDVVANASTNMTMIATIEWPMANGQQLTANSQRLMAYIGDELVGVAQPFTLSEKGQGDVLTGDVYFLTISSDASGTIRFTTEDGTPLYAYSLPSERGAGGVSRTGGVSYQPNAHHGSLEAPIILKPGDNRPYKVIENDHVVIYRNNEKYDVTGKKLHE